LNLRGHEETGALTVLADGWAAGSNARHLCGRAGPALQTSSDWRGLRRRSSNSSGFGTLTRLSKLATGSALEHALNRVEATARGDAWFVAAHPPRDRYQSVARGARALHYGAAQCTGRK